ncbi:Beta-lactamase 2 [Apiospora arundinis]|uniref:Beta-lactamase 2 n=1 Tax=Apiospora arundinis TaxID=335852 RepID=A0ABR2J5B5_9PEZI
MGPSKRLHVVAAAFIWAAISGVTTAVSLGPCPPLGPVLPAPVKPSADPDVQAAVKSFESSLTALTAGYNASAVSVAVKSIHEDHPFFNFQYTPPHLNTSGTHKVDADTVYRIASISKLYTVLGVLLLDGVRMDDPVTKYLPQLRNLKREPGEPVNEITTPDWDEITLGSLASHQSGIGSDMPLEISNSPGNWTDLGLPALPENPGPDCGGSSILPPCSISEFYRDFGKHHPVYGPFTSVVYSNVGIGILALVIEAVSGKSFDDYIQETVLDPLGLNSTFPSRPPSDTKRGFIPDTTADRNWWDADFGPWFSAAGGFYTSTNDFLTLGTAILSHKLLTPAQTRKWMKPKIATSSAGLMLGEPWEIFRADNVTADGRLVEVYTKTGDIWGYDAAFCLVPDYDMVASILTGGFEAGSATTFRLCSDVVRELLPALEKAGKAEARAAMAGTYADPATNSTLTLAVDESGGPGLSVTDWVVRGVNVSANYVNYATMDGNFVEGLYAPARLYPSGLKAGGQVSWRAHWDLNPPEANAKLDAGYVWAGFHCITWAELDRLIYKFNTLDDIVATVGEKDGVATSLDLRGFRVQLRRSSSS